MSVDPGLRGSGVAVWEGGSLKAAAYIKNPEKHERGPEAWHEMASAVWFYVTGGTNMLIDTLVIEIPQVYRDTFFRGVNPANLIELGGVDGAICSRFDARTRRGYFPRQWKGRRDKETHHVEVMKQLSDAEKNNIEQCAPSLMHNTIDGVGLGLFELIVNQGRKLVP